MNWDGSDYYEWKWIKASGNFLLKAGNEDKRKMLDRYSLGQFSQEVLNLNEDSKITKEQIQDFGKQALEQR